MLFAKSIIKIEEEKSILLEIMENLLKAVLVKLTFCTREMKGLGDFVLYSEGFFKNHVH